MDFHDAWTKALKETDIIRSRVSSLHTFNQTRVPYILLSASSINLGDTVVRKGDVMVEKPSLILPPNNPQLQGFEFDHIEEFNDSRLMNFLMIRGITMPSFKYNNTTQSLDVYEGGVQAAIQYYGEELQRAENVSTGLLVAPEDVWPFSILIFICTQIARDSERDIRRLLEEYKNKKRS